MMADKQAKAARSVGEGRKGLEEIGWGACVGGLGFHALQLPVAAAKVGDVAEDCGAVHLKIP
jgi:hypothetical protein